MGAVDSVTDIHSSSPPTGRFVHDKLLPATSNAVERGNRHHREMQKSVYRVRSKVCLEGRIALDMIRESRAEGRDQTTQALPQRVGGTHDPESILQSHW